MFNMTPQTQTKDHKNEALSENSPQEDDQKSGIANDKSFRKGILCRLKAIFIKEKTEHTLREAIEEYIEEAGENGETTSIAIHERLLLSNLLKLRDLTVIDVAIPRADIAAIDIETSQKDLLELLSERQFSRFPIFKDTLDNVVGTIHIKDIIACLAQKKRVVIEDLVREVPIVSPAMPVLDLLLMMRQKRKHLSLVVDEYGGIDGLVTIGDVIEAIVGEIEDEHEQDVPAVIKSMPDGTVIADGRVDIEEFENEFGQMLTEEEREDIDTLGGLASDLANRVPSRGEVLTHSSGMSLEILDADPRRVNRLRIRHIPKPEEQD
jgi:CBS domain containing-hemolysin-like protein